MNHAALTADLTETLNNMGFPNAVHVEVRGTLVVFFVLVTDGEKTHREEFTMETPSDLVCMPGVAALRLKAACFSSQMVHQGLAVL